VHCPCHDADKDGRPDLDVADGPLVYCFVCGRDGQGNIVARLKEQGLWPATVERRPHSTLARVEVGRRSWEIRDKLSILHAVHERVDHSDGDKEFVWRRPDGERGLDGRKAATLPLYGTDLLATHPKGSLVVVCEGEKAADAARRLGLVALGTVTGAGNPIHDDAVLRSLLPYEVAFWRDHDDKGRAHMADHAQRLLTLRRKDGLDDAMAPRLLDWPDAPEKGDAYDFVGLGGDRAGFDALLAAAPRITTLAAPSIEGEPWRPPVPLDAYAAPSFPSDVLPDWLGNYVRALAVATQTPPDLAGLLGLAVLATAAARRVVVEVRPGWSEPLNIYVLTFLAPGARKSAVFDAMTDPLLEYERDLVAEFASIISEKEQERRLAEGRLKAAEAAAVKAEDVEVDALEAEARALRETLDGTVVPPTPQLIADDVTAEALGRLLFENRERMAIFSAEGDLFEVMAGRYSDGGGNFSVYLKAHSGDPHKVNRVARPPDHLRHPALTLAITAQPAVLRGLARKEGFRGKGLLARFVYAVPVNLVGRRDSDPPPVPKAVEDRYRQAVRTLLAEHDPYDAIKKEPTTVPEPERLRFDFEACKRLVGFMIELEPRLGPGGDLEHLGDWAAKLTGLVVRVAGLLSLGDGRADRLPWRTVLSKETVEVSDATVERAIRFGRYALGQALAAFGEMGADPATDGARRLWHWIAEQGETTVRRAEAYQGNRSHFSKSADLDAPLALLVDHGYLRPVAPIVDRYAEGRRGPQGRSPSMAYEVNPLATAKAAGNAENPGNAPDGAGSDLSRDFQHFRDQGASAQDAANGRRRIVL
jgi:hypothetical protein